MDYLVELVGEESIKIAVVATALLLWGVAKAVAAALVRKADQQWLDHGDDSDQEIKVRRVTDKVLADSTLMSMLPRGVVERQVRRRKDTGPPAPPDKSPPD